MYVGGQKEWPTYQAILDYTEGVTVLFDPDVIAFEDLFDVFLSKTSLTQCSTSRQYMSGVWWHNSDQENIIQTKFREIENDQGIKVGLYRARVGDVYRAEEYHQKFFEKNNY